MKDRPVNLHFLNSCKAENNKKLFETIFGKKQKH